MSSTFSGWSVHVVVEGRNGSAVLSFARESPAPKSGK